MRRHIAVMISLLVGGNIVALAGVLLLWLGSPLALALFIAGCGGVFGSAVVGAAVELREGRAKT